MNSRGSQKKGGGEIPEASKGHQIAGTIGHTREERVEALKEAIRERWKRWENGEV